MNCREFTEFLHEYLSGALSEEERAAFDAHLAECPDCVAYLENYRTTILLTKVTFTIPETDPAPEGAPEKLIVAILRSRSERV